MFDERIDQNIRSGEQFVAMFPMWNQFTSESIVATMRQMSSGDVLWHRMSNKTLDGSSEENVPVDQVSTTITSTEFHEIYSWTEWKRTLFHIDVVFHFSITCQRNQVTFTNEVLEKNQGSGNLSMFFFLMRMKSMKFMNLFFIRSFVMMKDNRASTGKVRIEKVARPRRSARRRVSRTSSSCVRIEIDWL